MQYMQPNLSNMLEKHRLFTFSWVKPQNQLKYCSLRAECDGVLNINRLNKSEINQEFE
jgi:hypothetical protein